MTLAMVHPFDITLLDMLKAYATELGLHYDPAFAEDAQLCHMFRNDDGVIVGFVRGRSIKSLCTYRIESIYVRPEYRQKGYGTTMLTKLFKVLSTGAWGYNPAPDSIDFFPPSANIAAVRLAQKAGFLDIYVGLRRSL